MSEILQNSMPNPTDRDAYIVGVGAVSPAGVGAAPLWQAIVDQRSLIEIADSGFAVGRVSDADRAAVKADLAQCPTILNLAKQLGDSPLFDVQYFTVAALNEAMHQAGWDELTDRDGFILATTTGQIPLWENDLIDFLQHRISDDRLAVTFRQQTLGLTLKQLGLAMGFHGRTTLVTSACSASTQALVLARKWLNQGLVDRVLIGATELLCTLTLRGFDSFQLLAKEPSKPFDQHRTGINLSEAAAFLCLESTPSDRARARLTGGGISVDAYHMTAPEPEGRGCVQAMEAALATAQIDPEGIDWVHAHGTGSLQNDFAECKAIAQLLGHEVPVSSTKGVHGHPLAAAGVLEAIIDVFALEHQMIPGTATLTHKDPAILVNVFKDNRSQPVKSILKNTLGFGGANCSYVMRTLDGSV